MSNDDLAQITHQFGTRFDFEESLIKISLHNVGTTIKEVRTQVIFVQ